MCRVSPRLFRLGRSIPRPHYNSQTNFCASTPGAAFHLPICSLSRFLILPSFCCDRHQRFRICFISFVFCLIRSQCNADLGKPLDVAKISLFCRNFCQNTHFEHSNYSKTCKFNETCYYLCLFFLDAINLKTRLYFALKLVTSCR